MPHHTKLATLDHLQILARRFYRDGDGTVATFRRLAVALNEQMVPISTWGWNYACQVANGKIPASKKLTVAINRLYELRVSQRGSFEPVVVLAPNGFVEPRSVVMARSRKCARPECRTNFVPISSHHLYCSRNCRRLAQHK